MTEEFHQLINSDGILTKENNEKVLFKIKTCFYTNYIT